MCVILKWWNKLFAFGSGKALSNWEHVVGNVKENEHFEDSN
jgi:hypothetical protein